VGASILSARTDHTHMNRKTHTFTHAYLHTYIHIHTHTCISHTQRVTEPGVLVYHQHMPTMLKLSYIHTRTLIHAYTRMHTHTHVRTHMHAYARTHTRIVFLYTNRVVEPGVLAYHQHVPSTHTHTQPLSLSHTHTYT